MPRGDGTGPFGAGPLSGRGAGWCADAGRDIPSGSPTLGGGFGARRGGRGSSSGIWRGAQGSMQGGVGAFGAASPTDATQQQLLAQVKSLQQELEAMAGRLESMESGGRSK